MLRDTQCGLLRGELARTLSRSLRWRFAFDVELLARTRRLGGSIRSAGALGHVDESRVQPVRHSLQMARDARLRLWLWLGQ